MRASLVSVRKPIGSTVGSVWLSSTCSVPPGGADRDGAVEAAVLQAQVVEHAQSLTGEPAELVMVAFTLEFADDDQRKHHVVLGEPGHGPRVGQQHGGVQNVGPDSRLAADPAEGGLQSREAPTPARHPHKLTRSDRSVLACQSTRGPGAGPLALS